MILHFCNLFIIVLTLLLLLLLLIFLNFFFFYQFLQFYLQSETVNHCVKQYKTYEFCVDHCSTQIFCRFYFSLFLLFRYTKIQVCKAIDQIYSIIIIHMIHTYLPNMHAYIHTYRQTDRQTTHNIIHIMVQNLRVKVNYLCIKNKVPKRHLKYSFLVQLFGKKIFRITEHVCEKEKIPFGFNCQLCKIKILFSSNTNLYDDRFSFNLLENQKVYFLMCLFTRNTLM